jgi:hypothetical protein
LSLSAKWRWRLLQSENALWKEDLEAKYGVNIINMGIRSLGAVLYCASKWWKDIVSLERVVGVNWFSRELVRRIGNGRTLVRRAVRPLGSVFSIYILSQLIRKVRLGRWLIWWKVGSCGGCYGGRSCLFGNWSLF